MDSVVVSVRVKKRMMQNLEKEGIDVQSAFKEFLSQKELQLEHKKAIAKIMKMVQKNVKPSAKGFAVKSIREDRYVAH